VTVIPVSIIVPGCTRIGHSLIREYTRAQLRW
jgi:hypothetical protein